MQHAPAVQPVAPPGEALFQHWLGDCAADPWAPLSETAAKPYRFIWGAWLKYLAAQIAPHPAAVTAAANTSRDPACPLPHAWQQAQPVHVLQFLNQRTPSHKQLDVPSDITRRRYWRVLDRIYSHALLHGWMAASPLDGISAHDRPPSEDPQGAILSPRMWNALQQHLPQSTDLISARDRAVLLVLMHLGISSEEVRGLVLDDVLWTADASALSVHPKPSTQPPQGLPEQAPEPTISATAQRSGGTAQTLHPCALRISGSRAMQSRVLELPPAAAQALGVWLGYRAAYASMEGEPALFCTRKAPMLSTHTVLHLVSKTLKAASTGCPQEIPPRMGPQVLRNTVIVQWLQTGFSVDEVLQRSGLKTPHALGHLNRFVDV